MHGRPTMSSTTSFACPRCRSSLTVTPGRLECGNCKALYPVDVIPHFVEQHAYYGEVARDEMAQIVGAAERGDYEQSVREHVTDAWTRRYLLDEERSKWVELLPERNGTILEVGCGVGSHSMALAARCAKLQSIDSTSERAKITHYRCARMERDNVDVACASVAALPLTNACVDVVALNGVLEWVASGDGDGRPTDVQIRALEECARVLKPDGLLYIGIENRWSLRYWLGAPDDHGGLRFTPVMPRWVADLVSRRTTGKDYRTYTYGVRGYRSLLKRVGFEEIRFHVPVPDYKFAERIVPLTRRSMIEELRPQRVRSKSLRNRVLWLASAASVWLGAYSLPAHSFCILAKKPGMSGW